MRASAYALYQRNRMLGAFLLTYIVGELGVGLWIYLTPAVRGKRSIQILRLIRVISDFGCVTTAVILPGPESITNSLALHGALIFLHAIIIIT